MKDIYQGLTFPDKPIIETGIPTKEMAQFKPPSAYAFARARMNTTWAIIHISGLSDNEVPPVTEPTANIGADLAFPAHTLAQFLRKSPVMIANNIKDSMSDMEFIDSQVPEGGHVVTDGGYVNFHLDRQSFSKAVVQEITEGGNSYGHQDIGKNKVVVIDYSSPNIAKSMSVGHLRSTVIGESLSRIYTATGHEVITDNHLGDWGTQFGMLGRAHELWADEIPDLRDGTNPVRGLYTLYVKIHDEVQKERDILEAPFKAQLALIEDKNSPAAKKIEREIKALESPLEKEGRAWFLRLEQGDPKAQELLKWSTELSLKEFQRVYDMLGIKFDLSLGESAYVPMIPSLINKLLQTGVATKEADGSVISDLQDIKLGKLILTKRDGASVYATRDMATLAARDFWFNPDKIIYVVGGDQGEYFKQVFNTYDRFTNGDHPELIHVGFGRVNLPEGKMSTRAGRVVFLEDVLKDAITKAEERLDKSPNTTNLSSSEKRTLAEQIGIGAVIYFDLGQSRERNIQYDHDKALKMVGQSAPYIQYAHARAMAVLAKAQNEEPLPIPQIVITTPAEYGLVKEMAKYPDAITQAIKDNQPACIAASVFRVADAYTRFYGEDKILGTEDPILSTRLRLTDCAGQVIRNGLQLLGIQTPNQM